MTSGLEKSQESGSKRKLFHKRSRNMSNVQRKYFNLNILLNSQISHFIFQKQFLPLHFVVCLQLVCPGKIVEKNV